MPLVCSRWHDLMADASMWRILDVEPRAHRLLWPSSNDDCSNMEI